MADEPKFKVGQKVEIPPNFTPRGKILDARIDPYDPDEWEYLVHYTNDHGGGREEWFSENQIELDE